MKLQASLAAALALTLATPLAAQQAGGGTLDKIAASGEIALGVRESSVPFAYLDDKQQPIGYSVDLCMKIVDEVKAQLGKEIAVKFVPVNPKTRIQLMANGTIDMECGSTTNNLTRQEQVEFLPVTFITGTKLAVRKDSGINSIADLAGKSVAVAQGSTNERAIVATAEKMGLDIKTLLVRDIAEGMLSLETGRADAFASDHVLLFGQVQKSKTPDDYAVVGDFLSYDPYALMIRPNDHAFQLAGEKALAKLFRSGEINAIYDKWFGPMNMEQTDLLKAAFQLNALPE